MPKLYVYLGVVIFFYSNEHEPIHVHGSYQGQESKAEFILKEGQIVEIRLTTVKHAPPLSGKQEKLFLEIVEKYAEDIVDKWIKFFVYNEKISSQTITRRLK
ncbi:MAG: DUF4160 domain-containing protein [Bacteroidia bacterium]